ncbi:MAG: FixH family protein [Cyclobacteriaceae bacterium]|nr:FixH family protein [Cyclobacteriaceae bacterium]
MNWGKSITITFFVFGGLLATMVVISMQQDVDLVSEDYYKEEIEYQTHINKVKNFNKLDAKPVIQCSNEIKSCTIQFPKSMEVADLSGTVHFFRPSGSHHDKLFSLEPGEHIFKFNTEELISGLWTVKVEWSTEGKDYYFEQNIGL